MSELGWKFYPIPFEGPPVYEIRKGGDMSHTYVGPCKIDCPLECNVPEGMTLGVVPRPRHAWKDILPCPHVEDGCELTFIIVRKEDTGA